MTRVDASVAVQILLAISHHARQPSYLSSSSNPPVSRQPVPLPQYLARFPVSALASRWLAFSTSTPAAPQDDLPATNISPDTDLAPPFLVSLPQFPESRQPRLAV